MFDDERLARVLAKVPRQGPNGGCRLVVAPPLGKQAAGGVLKLRKEARLRYAPTVGRVIILCPPLS